jgi:hypothetical protein
MGAKSTNQRLALPLETKYPDLDIGAFTIKYNHD